MCVGGLLCFVLSFLLCIMNALTERKGDEREIQKKKGRMGDY